LTSLYAQYVLEREGFETIENDYGFATFKIEEDECYIRDIFVKKEHREKSIASELADFIMDRARTAGCRYLTGSVFADEDGTPSLKVLLAYGFSLSNVEGDMIYFKKEI